MASDDESGKKLLEMAQRIDRFMKSAQGPTLKALQAVADNLQSNPALKAIVEASRRLQESAESPAGKKLLALAVPRLYEAVVPKPEPAPAPPMMRRADEQELADRQRMFVTLVQTRALFHDCRQVQNLNKGDRYTALAPDIVLLALNFPIDEIDEVVGLHAERFVGALVKGATG